MPEVKRILIVCGTGIATSTVAAVKLQEVLKRRGIEVVTSQCKPAEIPASIATFRPHAIVSTTNVKGQWEVPLFNGLPLLTGIGADKLADDLAEVLQRSGS